MYIRIYLLYHYNIRMCLGVLRGSKSPQISQGGVKASTPLSQSKSHSRMSLAFNRLSIIPTEFNNDTEVSLLGTYICMYVC